MLRNAVFAAVCAHAGSDLHRLTLPKTNQSVSIRLITGYPSANGPEQIGPGGAAEHGNSRYERLSQRTSGKVQMPSAIEIWDEKQRAFEVARYTLDSFAVYLNDIADLLKKHNAPVPISI